MNDPAFGCLDLNLKSALIRTDTERMSANVGVPLGVFVGFGLCVAVVALTIAPKRTPETRRPETGREADRRRRAAGAAIGAGLVGVAAGPELSTTIPSHPVWTWILAGFLFWGVPLVAATVVARWAAKNLNRAWADVFWSWDPGRPLPDPIGKRGTAILIGSFVAGFVVAAVIVL